MRAAGTSPVIRRPERFKSRGRNGLVESPGLALGDLAFPVKCGDVVYEVYSSGGWLAGEGLQIWLAHIRVGDSVDGLGPSARADECAHRNIKSVTKTTGSDAPAALHG